MDILKDHISTGFYFILLSIFVLNGMNVIDAACTLPEDLQGSSWEYNYTDVSDNSDKSKTLVISTTTLQNSVISLSGQGTTLDDWTCINSLTISSTEGVVVFKSDSTFSDGPSTNYRLYLCMKFTKVTPDLYYFYLLSDIYDGVDPNERTRPFLTSNSPADAGPICETFCQYTETPKIRTLRRPGSNDSLPSNTLVCECDSPCSGSRKHSAGQSTDSREFIREYYDGWSRKHSAVLTITTCSIVIFGVLCLACSWWKKNRKRLNFSWWKTNRKEIKGARVLTLYDYLFPGMAVCIVIFVIAVVVLTICDGPDGPGCSSSAPHQVAEALLVFSLVIFALWSMIVIVCYNIGTGS